MTAAQPSRSNRRITLTPTVRPLLSAASIILSLLSNPNASSGATTPAVYPCRDQPVLEATELQGPWQFRFDPADEGGTAGWYESITNSADWQPITIPRVWNIPDGAVTGNVPHTVGWYQLRVPVPPNWREDVTLAFLGAQYSADVWVNNEYLGVHRGGFTPFLMDVSALAHATNELRVAVRVSNIVDANTVPAALCGWQHYGGLCREVYLLHQPTVRPKSINVSTRLLPDSTCIAKVEAPLWLQGFGQHEVAPGNGPIVPLELRRRDLIQMKESFDANVIRPGHYPNHPDLYNLCDELGLLVFTEIPVWQMWATPLAADDTWNLWLEPQLREMTESLRHHPSICFWGVANETRGAHDYYKRAANYMRQLAPSRPVSVVLEHWMDTDSAPLFDLQTRTAHFGWYHSGDVYEGPARLEPALLATRGKPFWIIETGGLANRDTLGGGYGDQARGKETYLDRIVHFNFANYTTLTNQITGVSVWSWTDFPRSGGIEPHGILDIAREPKLVAYSLRNLMHGDLRLFAVEEQSLVPAGKPWRAQLRTFNRSITPRKNLTARWTILKGQTPVANGNITFDAAPVRSQTIAPIDWTPPTNAPPGLYTVWTELLDRNERLHISNAAFDLQKPSRPGILRIPPPDETADTQRSITLGGISIPVHPFVGLQIPLEEGLYDLAFAQATRPLTNMPCTIRRSQITTQAWPASQ